MPRMLSWFRRMPWWHLPCLSLFALAVLYLTQSWPVVLGVFFLELALAQALYHHFYHPLAALREGVERYASGDFSTHIDVGAAVEYAPLAESINHMAADLDSRLSTIMQLEAVRRDFVANVSHELRTPITSIKGFLETLLDGALDSPQDAKRFLSIMSKHADRLSSIIEDLLMLSRLEQERTDIKVERTQLIEVLRSAAQLCEFKAAQKHMRIDINAPEELEVTINPQLIEQALVNLIDNAVKYSERQAPLRVQAQLRDHILTLQVVDQGRGIEPEYQSRIFERFYRVDKARSRKEGGTGLGLAIVKHIAQAHRGYAAVDSQPGQGSTFSIHLPQP